MLILGIETSCDDTAAALLEVKSGRFRLLNHLTASQTKLHAKYQGIVPEVAARAHLETIIPVLTEVLGHPVETRHASSLLDAIAITTGPGLITSLLIGVETAKALSFAWDVPLVSVNHIEGHIYSVLLSPVAFSETQHAASLQDIKFPAIALIVSGGHTELILMSARGGSASGGKNRGQYRLLGRTRDDASGECFDKAAKMLGLPYPGGPEISKRAKKGNPAAFDLPRPMIHEPGFEFSFSGLKNAIRLLIENIGRDVACNVSTKNDLCAAIEQAIVDVLVYKSLSAVTKYKPKTFILAGGVAANKKLRQTLSDNLPKSTRFLLPQPEYCMDNAAMIAVAAYHQIKKKKFVKYDKLKADANWELV
ncbi:MAG: tRNA (adenosine(37)-N6)-threonylcarbamoyltransferase complex transferase subunit TsaD [Candidatus Komeilibacteria bacterium RIFCSPLOWO2_02_FULL_48_11]|uniref:tRNA N6-adenosine threonylcarbamoyltransferase n=1 Tax=Candidatus Komeilibacteria bacterium RIFCSPLOWO2_02_FULL_48_11 TaxID=1798553 RepID=A0A1G2BUZ8_9BACT|nr:MAG: tRNA (adenosine(37)-N6)-threonylcarbamoyltransferase complex transferase subunit TsaD [Candidatus Komeilibacteria bacterium RIFCSPLOWO2_02_FULL_48_11]